MNLVISVQLQKGNSITTMKLLMSGTRNTTAMNNNNRRCTPVKIANLKLYRRRIFRNTKRLNTREFNIFVNHVTFAPLPKKTLISTIKLFM